jgi:hypothetical protein
VKHRSRKSPAVDPVMVEGARIDRAVTTAVREAVLAHKRAGRAVVGSVNGQIAWVKPEDIDAVTALPRAPRPRGRKAQ